MRAEINTDGKIEIFPMSRTELFALNYVYSNNYGLQQNVIINNDIFTDKITDITTYTYPEVSIEDIPF